MCAYIPLQGSLPAPEPSCGVNAKEEGGRGSFGLPGSTAESLGGLASSCLCSSLPHDVAVDSVSDTNRAVLQICVPDSAAMFREDNWFPQSLVQLVVTPCMDFQGYSSWGTVFWTIRPTGLFRFG